MTGRKKWVVMGILSLLMGLFLVSPTLRASAASDADVSVTTNAKTETNVGGGVYWNLQIPKEKLQTFKIGDTIARLKISPNAIYYDQLALTGMTNGSYVKTSDK